MAKMITESAVLSFVNDYRKQIATAKKNGAPYGERLSLFRHIFFSYFRLSDTVPAEMVDMFNSFAEKFYDKTALGYDGIIAEIKDRTELYAMIDGYVAIREFLKKPEGKTDIYDKENRICYEKKTGCGDWLRSERSTTFEEVIEEYKRKRTLIRWDYEYTARPDGMTGKKSVKDGEPEQERTKKNPSKEYSINIHIETTYRKLFEYMETYPTGIKTFFKESSRSGIAGVYHWEMQTIKNSKKKIAFLQGFNAWANGEEPEEETEEE